MQIEVQTMVYASGDIVQVTTLHDRIHEVHDRLSAELIRTKEEGIRTALIKLGWTPPMEEKNG